MGEYGRIVGESTGAAGGGGGGSFDPVGMVMDWVSGAIEAIGSLPTEILVILMAAVVIGGFVMAWRPS
jgi:hypothetical protein